MPATFEQPLPERTGHEDRPELSLGSQNELSE